MPPKRPKQYEDFPLSGRKCGFALSWKAGSEVFDLDLQAVAFNSKGQAIDAVYYNNLKGLGRGLTHTGDEKVGGERRGFQEVVWLNLEKMPQEAQLIVLVVASYKGGRIQDARAGRYHVLQDNTSTELTNYGLERLAAQAAVIGAAFRKGSGWALRLMEEQAPEGQHFVDILEPTIGDVARLFIPGAPRHIKASFAMNKGTIVDLPPTASFRGRRTCAGISWDDAKGSLDLDVSAILMDKNHEEVDTVFFGNEEAQGVRHSGDNLSGASSKGDREVITLDFDAVADEVQQIFFVINIYSKGITFDKIGSASCRVFAIGGREEDEFCNYRLAEAPKQEALVMARLFREPDGVRWGFQAIGAPASGRTYKDTLPLVKKIASTGMFGGTLRSDGYHGGLGRALPSEDVLEEPPLETMCSPRMVTPAGCGPEIGMPKVFIEGGMKAPSCGKECIVQ